MSHILLIEPDAVLARNYLHILKKDGHSVKWCQQAEEAIYLADKRQPDLVLLELQLAGHNGVEFLYELRSYPDLADVPVIVLSNIPAVSPGVSSLLWDQLRISQYHYKPHTKLETLRQSVKQVL